MEDLTSYNYVNNSSFSWTRSVFMIKIQRQLNLTFVFLCIVSIVVNDDQQDAYILAYLLIPNQLYMLRAMSSPIIRST